MDFDCNVYAIGIILDGKTSENGSASRGSRYNSSVRYYETYRSENDMFIIVISEDGSVDFIPEDKNMASSETKEKIIEETRRVAKDKGVDISESYNIFDVVA